MAVGVRTTCLAAVACATALLVPAAAAAAPGKDRSPDYIGHFDGQPDSEVRLRVAGGNAGPRMFLKPKRFERVCDNGNTIRSTFRPLSYEFTSGRVFFERDYSYYAGPHGVTYGRPFQEARGRIMPNDEVRATTGSRTTTRPTS